MPFLSAKAGIKPISNSLSGLLVSVLLIFLVRLFTGTGRVDVYPPQTLGVGNLPPRGLGSIDVGESVSLYEIDARAIHAAGGNDTLVKRDQYACKKGTPCKTYACCGSFFGGNEGECGFGDTFCGSDCDSQCDAKSECGQYSDPPGKTCPLNVCCSKFGFCGSTEEFCTNDCQSNCVLKPPEPAGRSSAPLLNRVIGYYEAWSSYRKCHAFPPRAIPVDGLTHVNFAFAYVDPSTLKITPMDSNTPEELFVQTADVKSLKSGNSELQVFVSVGGWSFSDNDTSTQAVFPDIASDPAKRKTFANNLASFMQQYGFDGVDLDWEYPGAPDRGGKEGVDTKNYVALLQTMRDTFDVTPRGNFGITFTIPSSYWYLRWFDVPAMLKYADWVNLMSYDLHGVWDEHDPIGSIVNPHTNLTEIEQSVELLWRNNVPPGKVVLGVGFYGRSFQLLDPKCSTPGCSFKGAAAPGTCTNAGGTLAYFEIMDIINEENPKVVHDDAAVVKWIQYGSSKNQWVSFDDADTLQAKVKWANDRGLGGLMIWSVDQDDNQFSALTGLVGGSIPSFQELLKRTSVNAAQHWAGLNGQDCKVSDCLSDDQKDSPAGYGLAPNGGGYPDKCGKGKKKYIFCPVDATPASCQWRGSGSCHGQCHPGESTLAHSPHGSTSCLKPGQQAFCCIDNTWANLIGNCGFKPCGTDCTGDTPYELSKKQITYGSIPNEPFGRPEVCTSKFCCGYNFQGCHWVGKGTCDDNECAASDVQVGLDSEGDTGAGCASIGRSKPLCCNPPADTSPFLPVPLEDLFPTLPPAVDVPHFDLQFISAQELAPVTGNTDASPQQAFGFVVIDGPASAVGSLSKRDGSHIQFVTQGTKKSGTHKAKYICMDTSFRSNCHDMHTGGIEGKIFRMPEEAGFATYVVAHSTNPAKDQRLPLHIKRMAPPDTVVHELEYSYNFTLAKRDVGDIFVRIDYADSHDYYEQIVTAKHDKRKEVIEPRFWSKSLNRWRSLIESLRSNSPGYSPVVADENLDVLLYGNDGKENGCSGGQDGFLKMGFSGLVRNQMRFGFTLVGRIAPALSLEEAYGFFDSSPLLSGTLSFDGRGDLNIPPGTNSHLFRSPLTAMEFSHPGIVSFKPQLNIEVQMAGAGTVDGKFDMKIRSQSSGTLTTNAPPGLGDFGGSAAGISYGGAFKGDFESDSTGDILRVQMITEAQMQMDVFGYGTSLSDAAVNFTSQLPHYFRVNNDGSGLIFTDADQQAISEVYDRGNQIPGWDDEASHPVGRTPNAKVVHTGSSQPPKRSPPAINGYAIFGGSDFIDCSNGGGAATIQCPPANITLKLFPDLADDPDGEGTSSGDPSKRDVLRALEKRVGGERDFDVHGPNGTFAITSHSYPNGRNGANLLKVNAEAGRWNFEDLSGCIGANFNGEGPSTGASYVTEHILELQTLSRFFEFIMGVPQQLRDGTAYTTRLPVVLQRFLRSDLLTRWGVWDPQGSAGDNEAPIDDMFAQFGDVNDASHLVNAEAGFNGIKARVWRGVNPIADDSWDANNLDDTSDPQNAENAITAILEVTGVFQYLNAEGINNNFAATANGLRGVFTRFQARFNAVNNLNFNIVGQWDEYIRNVLVPIIRNTAGQWVQRRLGILHENWTQARDRAQGQRQRQQAENFLRILEDIQNNFLDPDAMNNDIDLSRFLGSAPK